MEQFKMTWAFKNSTEERHMLVPFENQWEISPLHWFLKWEKAGKHLNYRLDSMKSQVNLTKCDVFFIFNNSKEWFLVDTGAVCLIWPAKLLKEKPKPVHLTLQVVNQSDIQT